MKSVQLNQSSHPTRLLNSTLYLLLTSITLTIFFIVGYRTWSVDFQGTRATSLMLHSRKGLTDREKRQIEMEKRRIPFYVYDFEETNWYASCQRTYPWMDYSLPENLEKQWYYHSDDFIFIQRILNHPWRTYNPNKAQVFILPTLFSFYSAFGNHASGDPINEAQQNLKYGCPWNLENLLCSGKSFDQMMTDTTNYLKNSAIFHKYGQVSRPENYRTHFICASHFFVNQKNTQKIMFAKHSYFLNEILPNFSFGTFESVIRSRYGAYNLDAIKRIMSNSLSGVVAEKPSWRCSVFVPYIEAKWTLGSHAQIDSELQGPDAFELWKKREYDFFFVGRMQFKESYKTRRLVSDSAPLAHNLMKQIGKELTYFITESFSPTIQYNKLIGNNPLLAGGNQRVYPECDAKNCLQEKRCSSCQLTRDLQKHHNSIASRSKFLLIIHGDTSTTSRLYDAIFNGVIPVIISPTLYQDGLPFQSRIPWRDITFNIPLSSLSDLVDEEVLAMNLFNIVNYPEYILEHKFRQMVKIRKEVSWIHPESRIIENILGDAKGQCVM